jgi:hypothetical protein
MQNLMARIQPKLLRMQTLIASAKQLASIEIKRFRIGFGEEYTRGDTFVSQPSTTYR